MAAVGSISSGVGFRNCQILAIGTTDYPAATTTAAYAGVTISGVKALEITDPEPRQVVHVGDDRPFALDILPATEPITGVLNSGKTNNTLDVVLTGKPEVTLGESKLYAIGTDASGNEAQVIMLAYRQAINSDLSDANYGKRVWEWRLFPRAWVVPIEPGFSEAAEDRKYAVRPQFATKYPWGTSFAVANEGVNIAQGFRGLSNGKPKLLAFNANNTATTFTVSPVATSTATMSVWSNGVLQTAGSVTVATNSLTFGVAPTTNAKVVLFYETA